MDKSCCRATVCSFVFARTDIITYSHVKCISLFALESTFGLLIYVLKSSISTYLCISISMVILIMYVKKCPIVFSTVLVRHSG